MGSGDAFGYAGGSRGPTDRGHVVGRCVDRRRFRITRGGRNSYCGCSVDGFVADGKHRCVELGTYRLSRGEHVGPVRSGAGDEPACVGGIQAVTKLVLAVLHREGCGYSADSRAGQNDNRKFGGVRELNRHRVARGHAGLLESIRDRVDRCVELRPGVGLWIAAEERRTIGSIDQCGRIRICLDGRANLSVECLHHAGKVALGGNCDRKLERVLMWNLWWPDERNRHPDPTC